MGRDPRYPNHIRLFQVLFNEDDDSLVFGVSTGDDTLRTFKKRYGMIGQHLREISDQILRQQWPHSMNERPWVHVIPVDDLIEHKTGLHEVDCVCQPKIDTRNRRVEHYAMDARGEWHKEINSPLWAFIEEGGVSDTNTGPGTDQAAGEKPEDC